MMFAFDPHRTAILLIGGDKTGLRESWYEEMVPIADVLYDEYLGAIEKEGTRMSGRKDFANLKREVEANPERRARLDQERQFVRTILGLTAMREARGATQRQIAQAWDVSQANVSQIERTQDIFLSTLRKYVAALGGQVEIRAVFPDEVITLLGDGETTEAVSAKRSASTTRAGSRIS